MSDGAGLNARAVERTITSTGSRTDVVIVGAGVAGLAAAVALAKEGAAVTLLERRPFVGGRAYSYTHPALGQTIDSQHVVVGCCTNFLDLMAQAGASESIRWYDDLCFLEPRPCADPRQSWIRPAPLPAPGHNILSFLGASMLRVRDKVSIAKGLAQFLHGYPESDDESFAMWLKQTRQTDRAIRHFWEPVVVAALNDVFERCSTKYAGKVFHETFLRSQAGGRLGIPTLPMTEFFQPVVSLAHELSVELRSGVAVKSVAQQPNGRWTAMTNDGYVEAPNVILAGNYRQTQELVASALPDLELDVERFVSAPITTVHLWYDREVVDLDHAVLLDSRIQWMFAKSRIRRSPKEQGSYLELVISASWAEIGMGRDEILASAIRELQMFFPGVRDARLMKSCVLKEARATFSVTPGLDRFRHSQRTAYPGLYLAGDWTATEWPSTMEGAVRSGRLAAGEVMGSRGRFLSAEASASGLMRWVSASAG